MLEEYNELILEHHENVRKKIVQSDLSPDERKRLWPVFNVAVASHLTKMKPLINPIQTKVESEIKLTAFLHDNKDGYKVTNKGLLFESASALREYNSILRKSRHDQVMSNLVNR